MLPASMEEKSPPLSQHRVQQSSHLLVSPGGTIPLLQLKHRELHCLMERLLDLSMIPSTDMGTLPRGDTPTRVLGNGGVERVAGRTKASTV